MIEDLVSLSYEELSDFIKEQGEASYRAEPRFLETMPPVFRFQR